jgi:NAD(P)-dependent dehydrogenase (short-subunit alcohol dehydrogenase family)
MRETGIGRAVARRFAVDGDHVSHDHIMRCGHPPSGTCLAQQAYAAGVRDAEILGPLDD